MILSEPFHVATIIEKLLPAWKDLERYLKHKQKIKDRGKQSDFRKETCENAKGVKGKYDGTQDEQKRM